MESSPEHCIKDISAGVRDDSIEIAKIRGQAIEVGREPGQFEKILADDKTVEKEGLSGDISIVPVSRLARESNKIEPEVEVSLQHDGYLLMAPEKFTKVL